ncbi:MAG: hypothetical protein ABIR96_00875 [Bdellovibrionota bacterium]
MERFSYVLGSRFLVLCLVFLALSACGQKPISESSDPEVVALADEAREISLKWLDAAAANSTSSEMSARIEAVRASLESSDLRSPPALYSDTCDTNSKGFVAAFVTEQNTSTSPDIFVCSHTKRFGKYFLAQVLIHESIHLTGIHDECATTQVEVDIMRGAFQEAFENSYMNRCGIAKN